MGKRGRISNLSVNPSHPRNPRLSSQNLREPRRNAIFVLQMPRHGTTDCNPPTADESYRYSRGAAAGSSHGREPVVSDPQELQALKGRHKEPTTTMYRHPGAAPFFRTAYRRLNYSAAARLWRPTISAVVHSIVAAKNHLNA